MKTKMHIKKILIALVTLLFLSCGERQKTQNTEITIAELLGESEIIIDTNNTEELNEIAVFDSTSINFVLTQHQIKFDTIKPLEHTLFDRFSYESIEKVNIFPKDSSAENSTLFVYRFKDSLALNNAFYNWLDCFGPNCEEVTLKERLEGVKSPPLWCNVYENIIVIRKYKMGNFESDLELQKSLTSFFKQTLRYHVHVNENKILNWE